MLVYRWFLFIIFNILIPVFTLLSIAYYVQRKYCTRKEIYVGLSTDISHTRITLNFKPSPAAYVLTYLA